MYCNAESQKVGKCEKCPDFSAGFDCTNNVHVKGVANCQKECYLGIVK